MYINALLSQEDMSENLSERSQQDEWKQFQLEEPGPFDVSEYPLNNMKTTT